MYTKPPTAVLLQRSADQLAASFRALALDAATDLAAVEATIAAFDHSDPAEASYAPAAVSKGLCRLVCLLGPLSIALEDLQRLNRQVAP